ncbi:hypothetical protein SLS60_008032 [Paraconiothyrium brasiliense]|uniref:Uncharacterized protein n=1 Tax=Paraconiothyrium brasiliense TaxID=300254 RepID=A0ABR3R429_9PLEO
MTPLIFATLLLATSTAFAAPTVHAARTVASCNPTNYTISSFTLDNSPPDWSVHFVFRSSFSNPSIIIDAAISGSVCEAFADSTGNFPNELACSTGRGNVEVDLRGPEPSGKYQVIHFWQCDGKNWMSSTPVDVDVAGSGKEFEPQNVREVPCGAPTCPENEKAGSVMHEVRDQEY